MRQLGCWLSAKLHSPGTSSSENLVFDSDKMGRKDQIKTNIPTECLSFSFSNKAKNITICSTDSEMIPNLLRMKFFLLLLVFLCFYSPPSYSSEKYIILLARTRECVCIRVRE